MYNKIDRKRSIMATVQDNFNLYICLQNGNQSTDDFYKVFTSTVDTINANGGQAGLHPSVYQRHLELIIAKDLVKSNTDVATLDDAAKNTLKKKHEKPARESAAGEYLACLFLLLADDNRFGPLKTQLENNFLMGEHEYPRDVLAAKRLMTDFSPPIGSTKSTQEKVPATDAAFVERGRSRSTAPP